MSVLGGVAKFLETTQVHFPRLHTACVHYKYFAANMYIVQALCVRMLRHTICHRMWPCTSFHFAKDKVLFLKMVENSETNFQNFLGEHAREPPLKATCMFYSHSVAPGNYSWTFLHTPLKSVNLVHFHQVPNPYTSKNTHSRMGESDSTVPSTYCKYVN